MWLLLAALSVIKHVGHCYEIMLHWKSWSVNLLVDSSLSLLFTVGLLPRNEFNVSKGVDIINSFNNKNCQIAFQDESICLATFASTNCY